MTTRKLGAAVLALALTAAGIVLAATADAGTAPSGPAAALQPRTAPTDQNDIRRWQHGRTVAPASPARAAATGETAALMVSVLDRSGAAPGPDHAGYALAFDLASGALTVVELTDGVGTVEVPAGSYLVQAFVETVEPGGAVSLSMPMQSRVSVAGKTATTLDARTTAPVDVAVDRADARLAGGTVQITQTTPEQTIWYAADFDYAGGLYVQPTGQVPGLALDVFGQLSAGGARTSPYLYAVQFRSAGEIPRRPSYAARTRSLAALTVSFAGQDRPGCARFGVSGYDPDLAVGLGGSVTLGAVPGEYPVYVTPTSDTVWRLSGEVLGPDCAETPGGDGFALAGQLFRTAGTYRVPFGRAPLGPGVASPAALPGAPTAADRDGDVLWIQIPVYADAGAHRGGRTAASFEEYPYTTGRTTLSVDGGETIGTSDRTGYGAFQVAPEAARYRLTTESTRDDAPWSNLSTGQRTTWTFTSEANAATAPLPLLAVRYDMALDDLNRAPSGGPFTFRAFAERNGSASGPRITSLSVTASFDDGATWQPVALQHRAGQWLATLDQPAGDGYVSLRAEARDADGNTVDQTTLRAYALRS